MRGWENLFICRPWKVMVNVYVDDFKPAEHGPLKRVWIALKEASLDINDPFSYQIYLGCAQRSIKDDRSILRQQITKYVFVTLYHTDSNINDRDGFCWSHRHTDGNGCNNHRYYIGTASSAPQHTYDQPPRSLTSVVDDETNIRVDLVNSGCLVRPFSLSLCTEIQILRIHLSIFGPMNYGIHLLHPTCKTG